MMRTLVALALVVALPLAASAQQNNIGSCGWGTKLFDGDSGLAPQVLGATTNGTSGNQTFGITSNTSGCTRNGAVKSTWKATAFVDQNMSKLALDMSRGQGESLDSLAALLGVSASDKALFDSTLQNHVAQIFSSPSVDSQSVSSSLRDVLASDVTLAVYAAKV